jgi:competence protein ComEA
MMRIKELRRSIAVALLGIAVALSGCSSYEPVANAAVNRESPPAERAINLNTATVAELTRLPGIGEGLAKRIIDHREEHGPFRKAEHVMMVEGIGDTRFRRIRDHIKTE